MSQNENKKDNPFLQKGNETKKGTNTNPFQTRMLQEGEKFAPRTEFFERFTEDNKNNDGNSE